MKVLKSLSVAAVLALAAPFAAAQAPSPLVVTNTNDSGAGSLRNAIDAANGAACTGSPPTITFAIPTSPDPGPYTIQPMTALPPLTCGLGTTIDGFSQSGASANTDTGGANDANLKIILNGSACIGCDGLQLQAGNTLVRGLSIHSFPNAGIVVNHSSGSDAVIRGNYIGTDPGGMNAFGNGGAGVLVQAGRLGVGGFAAEDRNLISANGGAGVRVFVTAFGAIRNNQIGGKRDGSAGNGNGGAGVSVPTASGELDVSGNYIRYNGGAGVEVLSGGFVAIQSNAIHGNAGKGIDLGASGNGLPPVPTILSITSGFLCEIPCTQITTEVEGTPFSSVSVEIFSNDTIPSPTQGQKPIGSNSESVGPTGKVQVVVTVFAPPQNITATATHDSCGDFCDVATSEFSPPFVPAVMLSPSSVAFAPQTVGTTSGPQTVTLTNTGTAPLDITDIATFGDFGYSGCGFPVTIPAGGSCTFAITFTPLTAGSLIGKIRITSNATGSPHDILLSGTGVSDRVPGISVSPTFLAFGTVALGSVSRDRLTVQNSGTAPLAIVAILTTGAFTHSHECPASLDPGRSCLIVVTFEATASGSHTGEVQILTNATPSPFVVPLSATVLASPPANLASETLVDFGQVVIHTSARQSLPLRNSGGERLVITEVLLSGARFAVEGSCIEIAPGESCTLVLVFTPNALGFVTGRLEIVSNSSGGRRQVDLLGEAVRAPTPQLELSVGGMGFGNQAIGTASAPRTVRLTSVGGAPVNFGGMETAPEFGLASSCGAVLAPGDFCELTVTFQPFAPGPRNARLTIRSDAEGAPHFVSITGTGCRFFSIGARRDPSRLCSP